MPITPPVIAKPGGVSIGGFGSQTRNRDRFLQNLRRKDDDEDEKKRKKKKDDRDGR